MTQTSTSTPTREELLSWYRQMALIRRVEEFAAKAYMQRKIQGFCHLYIGQEAVCVGASAALEPKDVVVSAYREHGQILARGATPMAVFSEMFGRETGTTHGVGGSMHMSSAALNFFGGFGIVGGHVPLGAGAAFAAKYTGDGRISLTYLGDGASHQGAFFEALAMAQLWKLPAVFIIENNFYAMGTSLDRQSYLTNLAQRADGVGMKQWQFQGFDVVDVYNNVKEAVDHARSGQGPVLLEAITYRYRGHSMSDPAKYRTKDELNEHRQKHDALDLAAARLIADYGVKQSELDTILSEVKAEAKAGYDEALLAPESNPDNLYNYVYAE